MLLVPLKCSLDSFFCGIWYEIEIPLYRSEDYKVTVLLLRRNSCKAQQNQVHTWWRHQMETFSALQAIRAGYSPVTGESPSQRPVTQSFDVFCYLNKRLSKQSWGWWFETPLRPLWRHSYDFPWVWCVRCLGLCFNAKISSCQSRKSHYMMTS